MVGSREINKFIKNNLTLKNMLQLQPTVPEEFKLKLMIKCSRNFNLKNISTFHNCTISKNTFL